MIITYHPEIYKGITKHESDKVGICYQMPGFEWPSHKKAYPFCHIRAYSHYKTRMKPRYLKGDKIQMNLIGGNVDQHTNEYKRKLKLRGIKIPDFLFGKEIPNFVNDISEFSEIILKDYGFIV